MSIFETTSILPANSTIFEKNLEQAANFPALPIVELADLVNPWKINARYLPWLAYRFAIEIWQDEQEAVSDLSRTGNVKKAGQKKKVLGHRAGFEIASHQRHGKRLA